jgi:hypothetical protein
VRLPVDAVQERIATQEKERKKVRRWKEKREGGLGVGIFYYY